MTRPGFGGEIPTFNRELARSAQKPIPRDGLSHAGHDTGRAFATNARLTAVMGQAAQSTGVTLLPAAALSVGHDICSADPWVFGYSPPPAADPSFAHAQYQPKGRVMAVIALALHRTQFPQWGRGVRAKI